MADDGMLLNFDLSSVSLGVPAAVKFKGGRWRDRNQAQRSVKRQRQGLPAGDKAAAAGAGAMAGAGDSVIDPDRAAKRRRTDGSGQKNWSSQSSRPRPTSSTTTTTTTSAIPAGRPQNGVTSRLFTGNPTALTDFHADDAEATATADKPETTPSNAPLSDEAATFHALGLSRRIAQHLSMKLLLKAPTAIQRDALPPLVQGDSDAFLQAETGSGKTLAYLLPLVQRIVALSENDDGTPREPGRAVKKFHRGSGLFAIVLAPTRELCKQIAAVLEKLLRCAPWIVSTTVLGGESKKSEKARIRKGVNILIATPGRLTDHLDHTEVLDVGTVRWLVLDEGDRLMEMGFEDDIRAIVAKIRQKPLAPTTKDGMVLPLGILPARRVTVLCSATMKMDVQKLGEISLEDAVHITAGVGGGGGGSGGDNGDAGTANHSEEGQAAFAAPSQLKQIYTITPAKLRLVTLIALLRAAFARKGSVMKAIVFISCADSVDFHFDLLRSPEALPAAPPKAVKSTAAATDDDAGAAPSDSSPAKTASPFKTAAAAARAAAPSPTATTVGLAAYLTSPANRTIVLHKLHGSLAQPVRTATLASFADEKNPAVLITTDIASRGLDVPAVDLVVEYDPAFAVADHVHRVGRTARAGRPGKAVLFLQPGCEEGYAAHLTATGASSTPTAQLYDSVLQQGFAAPVDVPAAFQQATGTFEEAAAGSQEQHDPSLPQQSWTKRAEAMQLHLEQRLLRVVAPAPAKKDSSKHDSKGKHGKNSKNSKNSKTQEPTSSKLLDAARQAFRSHVRAYATHVREERVYFDMTQLHLGHTAKSFGLREAPGGIGGGVVQRRATHRWAPGSGGSGGARHKATSAAAAAARGHGGGHDDDDDDGANGGDADADAARRMRDKMNAMMNASAEFNIG